MDSDSERAAILHPVRVGRQTRLSTWMFLATITLLSVPEQQAHFGRPLPANSYSHDQQSQCPGTIRVQVNLVPVDVIVTDANGQIVTNLKQEDFRIFENGKQQEIRHFSTQTLAPESSQPIPPLRATGPLDLAPQSARTFLILMGRGRIQRPFGAVDQLIRFVRKDLLPQDRVAVFAYNRATAFTSDHDAIVQVLERYKLIHERIESWFEIRMKGLAAIYGPTIPDSYQTEINKIFATSNELARHVPIEKTRDSKQMAKDAKAVMDEALIPGWSPTRDEFTKLESDAITDLPFDEFATTYSAANQDMQNLYACIRYMRFMQGEKHLLYFTPDGLFLPRLDYENGLAAFANDARVAIDTFQTGGTPFAANASRVFAISSLRNISELTGGRASIREDIGKFLSRVNEGTRMTYLLGYYPNDVNWNGKYRRIDVKVNRPGLKVAFRHGYFASATVRSYNREELLAFDRMSAALRYASDLGDIPFVFSANWEPVGQPQIKVDIQVDAGKIGLKLIDGHYVGKLYAAVFATDSKGNAVGDNWGTVDIDFAVEKYQEMINAGIRFSVPVPYKIAKPSLKIIMYDTGSDRLGSRRHQFDN
jgi:VWFA-related protein